MASSPAALKQQAAALELKKQPEKALALYHQLLTEHASSHEVDVALRNRVGDLHLRLGEVDEAIALFEKSADEYALSGFLNNAIALCNKILRQRPGHVPTLRRLARFSAEKGMVVDAQRHYLSVAEALEKLGQHGEALKALSEFAELSPDDVHVRSVVVEQLLRAGRRPDALPHLTVLHRLHMLAGRTHEAEGVAQVAREMDPDWTPESIDEIARKRTDPSLVFIDSDDDFGALEVSPMPGAALDRPTPTATLEGLELNAPAAVEMMAEPMGGLLDGFESTSFDAPPPQAAAPRESLMLDMPGQSAESVAADIEFLDMNGELEAPTDAPSLPVNSDLKPLILGEDGVLAVESSASPGALPPAAAFAEPDAEAPTYSREFDSLFADDLLPVGLPEPILEPPVAAVPPAPPVVPPPSVPVTVPDVAPVSAPAVSAPAEARPKRPTPSFISLAEILRDDEQPASPRMTIGEPAQTGDQLGDFDHILQEFRDGIEKTIAVDDFDSHFDLGIAFREMGLVDDAIAEFQAASRGRLRRVESIEALGGCFLDKGEPAVARTLLMQALNDPTVAHGDDTLRGILYLLGRSCEAIGARDESLRYYQRVYAVDIRFRDVAARIQTLQQPA